MTKRVPRAQLVEALRNATAHLIGATDAYKTFAGNSKRAGVRDAFYTTRLRDYERACKRARGTLRARSRRGATVARFDWATFLKQHHIQFFTRGPNTPRGKLTVHCPFCGNADPSDHMVIGSSGWHCWRNHEHGGRHPAKLVQALIGCTSFEADRITADVPTASIDDLAHVADMLQSRPRRELSKGLQMPADFHPFADDYPCRPFIGYLRNRGFKANADYLAWRYGLHYCRRGSFSGRIIFPLVHRGELISWTGRTIYPIEEVRYKSLTTDAELARKQDLPAALAPINSYFLWHDWIAANRDAHTFVLVEGPFDALRINVLGEPTIVSTCWTGSEPTRAQIELLHGLVRPYARRIVISDADMAEKADRIANRLRSLDFRAAVLPKDVDDPADLTNLQQLKLILS